MESIALERKIEMAFRAVFLEIAICTLPVIPNDMYSSIINELYFCISLFLIIKALFVGLLIWWYLLCRRNGRQAFSVFG